MCVNVCFSVRVDAPITGLVCVKKKNLKHLRRNSSLAKSHFLFPFVPNQLFDIERSFKSHGVFKFYYPDNTWASEQRCLNEYRLSPSGKLH